MELIVGGNRGREVKAVATTASGVRKLEFTATFHTAVERSKVVLIVTSGRQNGAKYLVTDAAF